MQDKGFLPIIIGVIALVVVFSCWPRSRTTLWPECCRPSQEA